MNARIDILARPDHALSIYEGLRDRRDLHLHVFNVLKRGSFLARCFPRRKQVAPEADVLMAFTLAKVALNGARKIRNFNWRRIEQIIAEYCYGRIDLSETALVHYWPMYCQETVRKARERFGLATLADVYEANPGFVNALVETEYQRHGIPFRTLNTQIEQNAFFAHETDVVVPSDYIRRSYERDYPNIRWHLAPYGFFGRRAERSLLRLKDNLRLRLVYVGRVCLEKGVHYLCDAMRGLETAVTLDIIGPVQHDHAPAFSRYRECSNIRFLGPKGNREAMAMLPDYDVFVMPSLSDAYSLAVMEALIHGLPVIVSENTGCFGEVRRYGCGDVVMTASAEALHQAIIAYQSPERRQAAIDGIARFDAAEAEGGYLSAINSIYQQRLANSGILS